MKRILSLILAVAMIFCLAACGGNKPVEETPEQEATRNEFNESIKNLYSNATGFSFKTYLSDITSLLSEEITDAMADLSGADIDLIETETLFTEGDYTVYDAVLVAELASGERRLYHDKIVTVLVDGKAKIVPQAMIAVEDQNKIIAKLNDFKDAIASFEKKSLDNFCKSSKSFASWYEKRKASLTVNATIFSMTDTVLTPPDPKTSDSRVLTWSEEFDTAKSLKDTKMGYKTTMTANDCKLTKDDSNIEFKNGSLIMTTRKYTQSDEYICSMPDGITTYSTMHYVGGYLEMRAKVPYGQGVWPSFWLKSDSPLKTQDYQVEIDVFEVFGSETGLGVTVHKWGNLHKQAHVGEFHFNSKQEAEQWHTYGFEWTDKEYKFYVDNNCFASILVDEAHDFSPDFPGMAGCQDYHYVILNNFVTTPAQSYQPSKPFTKETMRDVVYEVDYIRLYQNLENGRDKLLTQIGF